MDAKMVHDYIVAFGLEPRPTKQHKPVRLRDLGWSLLVETYSWGRVCVATNKHTTTVTWLEHGSIPDTLPRWAAYARHRFDNPGCVGHHEAGDQTCDGDGSEANPPCVWRRICRQVKGRAESVRTTPEQAIIFMIDDDANEVPPSATRYRSPVPRPILPPEDAQSEQEGGQDDEEEGEPRNAGHLGSPGDPYVFTESRCVALKLMAAICAAIPLEYAGEMEHRCHAGGVFYKDRIKKSRHFTLYIRRSNETATPRAVAYLYPNRRRPGVKIQLITPEESTALLRAALPHTLRVVQWKDGSEHPTVIDNIEHKHIGQLARVIGQHIRDGHWPRLSEA